MGSGSSRSLFEEAKPTWHEVPNPRTATHGASRMVDAKSPYEPHMTLYTNLMERRKYDDGSRRIFGWRKIDPKTKEAGAYEWVTYGEFLSQVEDISAGMVHELGLQRQEPVGVFSKNRLEWVLVEHGASRMSYQLVPLYDTLGPTAIPFILNHTEMRVIFCAEAQIAALEKCIDECKNVKIIVQYEDVDDAKVQFFAAKGVQLKSLKSIMAVGKSKPVNADPPTADDIATICYTSGTTGNPKGALLSHGNLMAAAVASGPYNPITANDTHLSYLPLAHVFERVMQILTIRPGGAIGFYQGEVAKLIDDLAALKPTIFPSVPRVLNRVHDRISQGVEKAGGLKQKLFNMAYKSKKRRLQRGYVQHSFWDALVFNKVKNLMGGDVRIMMNGSAPISQDCKEFLQIVFGVPVVEGYGMTETAAVISLSTPAFAPGTHVGTPVPGLEVCLMDVPEMNYTSNDKPAPRGEVCVRGPQVFKGYYKEADKTAEAVDQDGWLHTGDIGKWNEDGTLSIIDRKKNIFKLSQGEYVAPEKIENVYIKSSLVAQMFVHGHSLQNYLVGIVVPEKESVEEWARANGVKTTNFQELCKNEELKKAIDKDLEELAKKFGLFRFERVAKLHLHHEPWTPENNMMTPTFKLKRPQLVEYYANEIDAMYKPASA